MTQEKIRYWHFQDIKSIGKDAVIVESSDVLKRASDIKSRASYIAKENKYLTKTKIITEDGVELGNVTDVYFDDKTGNVADLEVSQGTLHNIKSGKKRVKVEDVLTVGEDATIVKGYIEENMKEQAQNEGIQAERALLKGKYKTQEVVDQIPQLYQDSGSLGGKSEHTVEHILPPGTNIEIPGETMFTTIKETKIKPSK